MAREVPLAIYAGWGAFRSAAAPRCHAVARPEPDGRDRGAAALSALVRAPGAVPQLHIRLARPRAADAPAMIELAERRIALAGRGVDLWVADPRVEPALLAAMRGGGSLRVRTRDAAGRAVADRYLLTGFATALDAALIGCARPTR